MDRHRRQAERTALIRFSHELEDDHVVHTKKAALMLDAESCWGRCLSSADRRDREFVLAALKSPKVPRQLKWRYGGFDQTCPMYLRTDREIFLKRLKLLGDDFEETYANQKYRVPNGFRNDKEVMLSIVCRNSLALSYATKQLKNDREVVTAAIQNKQSFAPQAIQHASKKLRGDRRMARAVLRHGHGIKAFALLDRKLRSDYKLALLAVKSSSEAFNASYEILSFLPDEMLEDADIVYEAVKRRGSNLRLVNDLVLLDDIEIVKAACQNDGRAFEYCPEGPVRDELLRGSNLKMVLSNGGCLALREKKAEYWLRHAFLIPAVENGFVLSSKFSLRLYENNRALFWNVLRHTCSPFSQLKALPEDLRCNSEVGMALFKTNKAIDKGMLASRLASNVPNRVSRKYIRELLSILEHEYAGMFDLSCGCGQIWDEKAIVITLCEFDGMYYSFASSRLKDDLDVVRAALSGSVCTAVICRVPKTILLQHEDIAAMAVKACSAGGSSSMHIYQYLGGDLCRKPVVLREWARKNWSLYHFYDGAKLSDRDAFVEAAKHCTSDQECRSLFYRFTKGVRGNKAFMMPAVQANPLILKFAERSLLEDFNFLLSIINDSGKDALKYLSHKDKDFDYMSNFACQVRERLACNDGFLILFLGAIALDPPQDERAKRRRTCRGPANRCRLRMLDVGVDNQSESTTIKRTIAEFAGILLGPELQSLRSALDCVTFWGY